MSACGPLAALPVITDLADQPWTALKYLITPLAELDERSPLAAIKGKDPVARERALRLGRILAGDGFG